MKKATTLPDILQSCDPRPLRRDELDTFFVDTMQARDPVKSRRQDLRERLERDPDAKAKLLLSGHGGCGKSTELVKLAQEIEQSFLTVTFSVAQECNLAHVPVEDVLVIMMERLLDACEREGLQKELELNGKTLEAIYNWFSVELDISEQKTVAGGEAEGGIDSSRSLLGKTLGLFVKMKAYIRRADSRTHRTTLEKPHRLSELTGHCNLLVKAVQLALGTEKKLLIVVEDLDKVNIEDARRIFIEQPAVLAELECNMICTVPIFLLHSPDRSAFDQYFKVVELPMARVCEFDGSPYADGRETVKQIIDKRIDSRLVDNDALGFLIEMTGGVLRDIFEVLIVAGGAAESLSAQGKQDLRITRDNVRYGLNRKKTEYARAITTIGLPEDWNLTIKQLYDKLRELKGQSVRVLPSEPVVMVLLKAKAVIEYNGEGWFAVHPLVRELVESATP